jgi:hypothetical protein
LPVHFELLFDGNLFYFVSIRHSVLCSTYKTLSKVKLDCHGSFLSGISGWQPKKPIDSLPLLTTFSIEYEGTSPKAALVYFAAVTDDVLSFSVADSADKPTLETLYRGTTQTFFALASKLKIASYLNLIPNQTPKLDTGKNWLASKGPILTASGVELLGITLQRPTGSSTYKGRIRGGIALPFGYTQDRFIIRNPVAQHGKLPKIQEP